MIKHNILGFEKKLMAMAAIQGKSIKEFVIERTLGSSNNEKSALRELEDLLDGRIRAAKAGAAVHRTAKAVFAEALREKARREAKR